MLLWSASIFIGMFSIPFAVEYRDYAHALAWHIAHGSDAVVGGHRVRLPLLWWKADIDQWDTSLLQRAWPARRLLPPQIKVTPALAGSVRKTDAEELAAIKFLLAFTSHNDHKNPGPSIDDHSLLILKATPFTLYCDQWISSRSEIEIVRMLNCSAANVQYTFSYSAPSLLQHRKADAIAKEAESILTSLR